jgi:hypothetical protein
MGTKFYGGMSGTQSCRTSSASSSHSHGLTDTTTTPKEDSLVPNP